MPHVDGASLQLKIPARSSLGDVKSSSSSSFRAVNRFSDWDATRMPQRVVMPPKVGEERPALELPWNPSLLASGYGGILV